MVRVVVVRLRGVVTGYGEEVQVSRLEGALPWWWWTVVKKFFFLQACQTRGLGQR